jgi:hypothetical protein
MANAAAHGLAVLTGRAGRAPADVQEQEQEAEQPSSAARRAALDRVLATVRHKWGQQSLVRLDEVLATRDDGVTRAGRRPPPATKRRRELPPWWPVALSVSEATGAVRRPHLLEVIGESGTGRLSLAMAWLAAARPTLAAVVEPVIESGRNVRPVRDTRDTQSASAGSVPVAGSSGARRSRSESAESWRTQFYPPAAHNAGVDLRRLVLVRPPAGEPRGALDAVAVLLRSQAFDVVLCPLPAGTRISLLFGGKLATLAARSGTTLLLLTTPSRLSVSTARTGRARQRNPGNWGNGGDRRERGVLGAFADYRVRLIARRWLWVDREIAGMTLRVATERARAEAALGTQNDGAPPEHELTFCLQRSVRPGGHEDSGHGDRDRDGDHGSAPDRLYLAAAVRVERRQPAGSAAFGGDSGDSGTADDGALPAGHALGRVAGVFA